MDIVDGSGMRLRCMCNNVFINGHLHTSEVMKNKLAIFLSSIDCFR